jgi:branched-chain amino acid aminotransferase
MSDVKTWVNGTLVEPAEALVSVFDHGLTVGDGVFETLKVTDGAPFALSRHLRRLADSARMLRLPKPDLDLVRHAVDETLTESTVRTPHRLRITYTGGLSPLGSDRGEASPTLVVGLAPLAPWPRTALVTTLPWTRNENGATAGVKSTSYADNVLALSYARQRGAGEALFANTRGRLCEGTGSNIFLVLDGEVVTPPLTSGCLAGITRELVLEWTDAREQDLPASALGDAEEVFLTSATRDIQPVSDIDGSTLFDAPGPVTRRTAEVFAARAAEDIDP